MTMDKDTTDKEQGDDIKHPSKVGKVVKTIFLVLVWVCLVSTVVELLMYGLAHEKFVLIAQVSSKGSGESRQSLRCSQTPNTKIDVQEKSTTFRRKNPDLDLCTTLYSMKTPFDAFELLCRKKYLKIQWKTVHLLHYFFLIFFSVV